MNNNEWTEADNREYNDIKRHIYYTDGKIDGITRQEFNRYCELNGKLNTLAARIKTMENDIKAGKADKIAGYYDKWYRYNRKDEGAAYDIGFNSVECKLENGIKIIECNRI